MARRMAILRVSDELLRTLLPDGWEKSSLKAIHRALQLPDDVCIDAASPHVFFQCNQVALRLEGDMFCEVPDESQMMEVSAEFMIDEGGHGRFHRWTGPGLRCDLPDDRHEPSQQNSSSGPDESLPESKVRWREWL